jgi:peroxiredoxin
MRFLRPLFVLLLCAASLAAADPTRRAPGFSLVDMNGQMRDLADYRGKVVILEFMQSTCPHCATFIEILRNVDRRFPGKVQVLAIANPPADSPQTLRQYIAGHKITYPVMLDCGQMAYTYVLKGNIDLPTIYVIDGNGMIRSQYAYGPLTRGIFEGNDLYNEIARLTGSPARK